MLTGSSTRKLRRGEVNLLAGRAWEAQLFPLTYHELPQFDLERYLFFGGLPAVYLSAKPAEELRAYVSTYMRQEIQEEGLVRRLPAFTRFLHTMALSNGEILNYAKIANDCQTAPSTVAAYVQVLADTLLAAPLPPWLAAKKRKAVRTSKLYFFDPGVARALAGIRSIERNSNFYGKSFEQFIWMELRAWLSYTRREEELSFWRTRHGYEVDFLIGSEVADRSQGEQVGQFQRFKRTACPRRRRHLPKILSHQPRYPQQKIRAIPRLALAHFPRSIMGR